MRRRNIVGSGLGILLGLVWAIPGHAEILTLDQVYLQAFKKNEEIGIAREEIRYSEEEKNRVRSAVLPKLTVTGTYNRYPEKARDLGTSTVILQPQDSYGVEVKLEQPIFSGGKNHVGLRIADRGIEVARENLDLESEGLLARVAQTYYALLKAQKTLEAQRRNVERLREHRRLSDLRYKVGEVTESVLLRAESELAGALAVEVSRQNEVEVRRRELQILAGLADGFEIEDPPLPEVPAESGTALTDLAMRNRSDLRRVELQERIGEERVRFARGNFFPSLSLEGTYFSRNQDPRSTFFIDQSWVVGARIEFPLFEGGLRRAELTQTQARLSESRLETVRLKKQIDLDLARATLTLGAVTKVLDSRKEQQKFSAKNFEMISRQYTFGLVTNVDLLDANQVLIEAERDLIEATYDRHIAILGLQQSAGIFLSRALGQTQTEM